VVGHPVVNRRRYTPVGPHHDAGHHDAGHHDVGIPADKYQVEKRGRTYFVVNRDNLGLFGVYPTREQAQMQADTLNVVFRAGR
jgi:hypothetical protein